MSAVLDITEMSYTHRVECEDACLVIKDNRSSHNQKKKALKVLAKHASRHPELCLFAVGELLGEESRDLLNASLTINKCNRRDEAGVIDAFMRFAFHLYCAVKDAEVQNNADAVEFLFRCCVEAGDTMAMFCFANYMKFARFGNLDENELHEANKFCLLAFDADDETV